MGLEDALREHLVDMFSRMGEKIDRAVEEEDERQALEEEDHIDGDIDMTVWQDKYGFDSTRGGKGKGRGKRKGKKKKKKDKRSARSRGRHFDAGRAANRSRRSNMAQKQIKSRLKLKGKRR